MISQLLMLVAIVMIITANPDMTVIKLWLS